MTDKRIHIVAFDVPYPADYGGVIDVYYRIKALYQLGFKITLHCFEYGRGKQTHLDEITEKTYYYKRQKSFLNGFNKRPFIVSSRRSKEILNRLLEDEYPILFEGLHTTWCLENKAIQKRVTYVRTHNVEHDYYSGLANKAGLLKKIYFQQEANKLKKYESILNYSTKIFAISEKDATHFNTVSENVSVLPACFDTFENTTLNSTEKYALFHGKLSVSENEEAAVWVIENIWKKEKTLLPLKIAGKDASNRLLELAHQYNITVISNPSEEEMNELISKARIHVLVSDQATGVKLKLLTSIQSSGHVVVNPLMTEGTDLSHLCSVCENGSEFVSKIQEIQEEELSKAAFDQRNHFLKTHFNTLENCKVFISCIPPSEGGRGEDNSVC